MTGQDNLLKAVELWSGMDANKRSAMAELMQGHLHATQAHQNYDEFEVMLARTNETNEIWFLGRLIKGKKIVDDGIPVVRAEIENGELVLGKTIDGFPLRNQ